MDQFYDWRGMNALCHGLDFFGKRAISAHGHAPCARRTRMFIHGAMDIIVMIALSFVSDTFPIQAWKTCVVRVRKCASWNASQVKKTDRKVYKN